MSSITNAGTTFGIYDARTLAMGSTSVASARNGNAQFYNAALLAFNDDIEERTQDGRFYFPLLIPQFSDSAITIEDIARESSSRIVSTVIGEFNANPDPLTAQAVVNATESLDASLAKLDGQDLFADVYVGMGGGESGLFRGAGFFFGARLLAGGQSTISDTDRALLAAYQEGLTFVATNGAQGVAHPELFNANGALIDPESDFESTASAAGAVVTEAGVAISRQLYLLGSPIAAGIGIKVQSIDTFEDTERVVDDRIDVNQNNDFDAKLNFDLGFAKEFGDRWRIGLAVKDVIPRNYRTSQNTIVRMRPRARIGAAYQVGALQISADADVTQNEPIGGELPTQEVAVGAEWAFEIPIRLRAGFRHDLESNRDGIASVGIGTRWRRFVFDLAYADGGDARSAAAQIGVAF